MPGRTTGREEGGQKAPQCGRGSGGSGGCGLGCQTKQPSPGNAGCAPWGKASYKTKGIPGAGPDGSVTPGGAVDRPHGRPGVRARIVSSVLCLSFVSACSIVRRNTLSVCVNKGAGNFVACAYMERRATASAPILLGHELSWKILGSSLQVLWGPCLVGTKLKYQSLAVITNLHIPW